MAVAGEPSPGTSGSDGSPATQQQQKCCLGALYFSAALNAKAKTPVCAGVRQTIGSAQDFSSLQTETVPPGHFRYMCVGYSMYNETRMKERQGKGGAHVELPYCEGLEVVSAAAMQHQHKPVLLQNGGVNEAVGAAARVPDDDRRAGLHARERRSFVPSPLGGVRLEDFPERFLRSSRKIVDRCISNAAAVGGTVRHAAKTVQDGVWGRRDT